ncbi:MAG: toll/interleukin-1 receptor domain-containing protein [Knoellia sp.]
MSFSFIAPPTWPPPPPRWRPPKDWRPPQGWGPAPDDWTWWTEEPGSDSLANDLHRIFISYRRSDCQSQANAVHDGLRNRLANASVFMDIDAIPIGVDFEKHIRGEIQVCDQVLVLIGDNWLDCRPGSEIRRIDEPEDFVRLEIENAFASPRAAVIPVLVEGAKMPSRSELPESIAGLGRLNAFEMDDSRWQADILRLSTTLANADREQKARAAAAYGPSGHPDLRPPPDPTTLPHNFKPPVTTPQRPEELGLRRQGGTASPWMGWLVAALPLLTCGLLSWVPPLRSALQRPGLPSLRKKLLVMSGTLVVLAILSFVAISIAPDGADGVATGPLVGLGTIMLLITMIAGSTVGVIYRDPPNN